MSSACARRASRQRECSRGKMDIHKLVNVAGKVTTKMPVGNRTKDEYVRIRAKVRKQWETLYNASPKKTRALLVDYIKKQHESIRTYLHNTVFCSLLFFPLTVLNLLPVTSFRMAHINNIVNCLKTNLLTYEGFLRFYVILLDSNNQKPARVNKIRSLHFGQLLKKIRAINPADERHLAKLYMRVRGKTRVIDLNNLRNGLSHNYSIEKGILHVEYARGKRLREMKIPTEFLVELNQALAFRSAGFNYEMAYCWGTLAKNARS